MIDILPLLGIVLCGGVLFVSFIAGVVMLLIKLGVIMQKASEPAHTDMGGYSLNQGRDVGKDE
jgi:hypothetical protein